MSNGKLMTSHVQEEPNESGCTLTILGSSFKCIFKGFFCPFGTFSVCRLFCLLLKVHVSQSFGSKIQDFFQTFSKTKIIISLSNKGDKQRPLKNTGIKLFS